MTATRPVARRQIPVRTPTEEGPVLTVADLLATVERLPEPDRSAARARVEDAVQGDARRCRALLDALALDLDRAPAAASA